MTAPENSQHTHDQQASESSRRQEPRDRRETFCRPPGQSERRCGGLTRRRSGARDCHILDAACEQLPAWSPALFACLRGFGLTLEEAEDIVQDVLLTWLRLTTPPNDPGAWLRRVAKNRAINACRTKRNRSSLRLDYAAHKVADEVPDEVEWCDTVRAVQDAVEALPEDLRIVANLCLMQGMSQAEAASVCKVSPGTMCRRLERARTLLYAGLAAREFDL